MVADVATSAPWELSRAVEAMVGKLRSFGGRIEESTPEGVLAIFGLEPDEDAPRRAALAAIAVQKQAARAQREEGRRPGVTAGLHAAWLTPGPAADRIGPDAGAWRDARGTLRGALAHAAPGTVVATAGAARFLRRRFDLVPVEAGADAAPTAWQVVRPAEPGRSRFVGRQHELRLLLERLELAHAGRGQVVMLVGEPGVGKSRLLHEFRRQLGATVTWVEGQALSFGRAMPFHPVIDMLKRVFGIDDGDPEALVAGKIERGGRQLGEDLSEVLPFLRYLLSVDPGDPAVLTMDPKLRHARILRSTHLLLERGAELRTHVLALEDAHWTDPATEDWITRLAEGLSAKRALVIVTARPDYRPPFGHLGFHTSLALSTLSSAETLHIAAELIGADRLPSEIQALIVDKADGNPFFVEELVRSLHEQGVIRRDGDRVVVGTGLDRVAVPDTVEELVLARIDRLADGAKDLLTVASVIGKKVPLPLLRALTQRSEEERLVDDLRALQVAGFLYETRIFPEAEYTFKHALTQDVAHAHLKPERQRTLHAGVVEAIERLYAGRLGEHVERLAHHALRGELWQRAVRYFREAGAKAFDRSANREAVVLFEQALVALGHLPEQRETIQEAIDIRLVLRSALLQLGEIRRMTDRIREAEALATAAGDRRRLAWAWTYMTVCHLFGGEPGQALVLGERASALAEAVGDVGLRATALTPWAHACRERGAYGAALELLRRAIDALKGDLLRERFGQAMPPALYARNLAALCLAELGEFPEAVALGTESMELAQALDVPFPAILARIALGHTYLVQGRLEDAAAVLDAALEIIETRDTPAWFPWAAATRGHVLALSGRAAAAVPLLERALERAAALPFLFGHSLWLAWLAHGHQLAGRASEALRLGEEAVRLSGERGERGYEAWARHILGAVVAGRDGSVPARAEALEREALALAGELGMRPLVARCEWVLGELARRRGDEAHAGRHLGRARSLFTVLDMTEPAALTS